MPCKQMTLPRQLLPWMAPACKACMLRKSRKARCTMVTMPPLYTSGLKGHFAEGLFPSCAPAKLDSGVRSNACGVQDDLLYETLTVYETLYYAAMLRLPSTMSAEQKVERVDHVIHTLGLNKCRDTIVGRH